jgi:hypothetical protein
MPERLADGTLQINPDDIRDVLGLIEGDDLNSSLQTLAPQVAMWRMARDFGVRGAVYSTDSYQVSLYVKDHYFGVRTKDTSTGLLLLHCFNDSPVFNRGIEFSIPEGDEAPPADFILREKGFYVINILPQHEVYRFWPNFTPANLDKIKAVADRFGTDTSLHKFYQDAVAMWQEETGLAYPSDSKTPKQVEDRLAELSRLEYERVQNKVKEDLQQTWDSAKRRFVETEGKPEEERRRLRFTAAFDVLINLQYEFSYSRLVPIALSRLECQTDRDNDLIYACIEKSGSLEEFLEQVLHNLVERVDREREFRKTINEMWVEIQGQEGNPQELLTRMLTQFGFLATTQQKEIVWDQEGVIKEVLRIYNALEVKDKGNIGSEVADQALLQNQEVHDIVQFLTSTKPEYAEFQEDIPF